MALTCTAIGKALKGKNARKACWLLTETKKGWRLSLEVGRGRKNHESFPLRGHYFSDSIVAMQALDTLNIVFVHLKD